MRRPPTSRRGQAFTEFLLAIPILVALFFIVTQGATILNRAERTEMALWPILRGDTFDFKHRVSASSVSGALTASVFPAGDTFSYSASTQLTPVDAFAWVNPLMWPMDRVATVRDNFTTFLPQPAYNRWITQFGATPVGGHTVQTKSTAQTIQNQL